VHVLAHRRRVPARPPGANKEAFRHVQLAAPSGGEARARAFFGGLLGLEEVPKPANLAGRGGAWFRGPGFELHVGVEDDFRPARKAHLARQVSDLKLLRRRLREHGVETWGDEPLPGRERFYASDPFGNRLEFLSPETGGA
jgi:catechol 2,3-dioxygenase-like lactoylglutathione lyase family enzyme